MTTRPLASTIDGRVTQHLRKSPALGRTVLRCVAVLTAVLAWGSLPAWASSGTSQNAPGLLPEHPGPHGYFEYTLAPNSSTAGTVELDNLSPFPANYVVYPVTATTSPVSGVSYGQINPLHRGITAWIHISATYLTIPAGGNLQDHFTVTVPLGASPGQYVAGLAAQNTAAPTTSAPISSTQRGIRLLTTTRVIVAIVVRVPGPTAPAAGFGKVRITLQQHRRQVLTIPIKDTGNILMKPYLSGAVRACSGGSAILSLSRQLDTFVPHTAITYPWYLNNEVIPAGCYRATLALATGGATLATYSGIVTVGTNAVQVTPPSSSQILHQISLPSWLIPAAAVTGLLLLVAALLLIRASKERRRLLRQLETDPTLGEYVPRHSPKISDG